MKTISQLLILIIVSGTTAFAQSADQASDKDMYIKILAGANYVDTVDFNAANGSSFIVGDSDIDFGSLYGVAFGYRPNSSFSVELEYSRKSSSIGDVTIDGANLIDSGDFSIGAVTLNGFYHLNNFEFINPYFGVGLGAVTSIDYDLEIEGYGGSRDLDRGTFVFQAMAGLDYKISPEITLFTEARIFTASSPEVSNDISPMNINYESVSAIGGVAFNF